MKRLPKVYEHFESIIEFESIMELCSSKLMQQEAPHAAFHFNLMRFQLICFELCRGNIVSDRKKRRVGPGCARHSVSAQVLEPAQCK